MWKKNVTENKGGRKKKKKRKKVINKNGMSQFGSGRPRKDRYTKRMREENGEAE